MGNEARGVVIDCHGQTRQVASLYVCDAGVFQKGTGKITTVSFMAFPLRTCEHLIENFRREEHRSA
jgi:choline dehydrogenase-like flavoprotein